MKHSSALLAAIFTLASLIYGCSSDEAPARVDGSSDSTGGAAADGSDATSGPTKLDSDGPAKGPLPSELGIGSLVPAKGVSTGGDAVTIVGSGFEEGVAVEIGGVPAVSPVRISGSLVSILSPAGKPGRADVVVTNPSGKLARLDEGFLYYDAFGIDSITPSSGPQSGGIAVTVKGFGFVPESVVLFGSRVAIEVKVVDAETILCIAPSSEVAGPTTVRVTTPAGVSSLEKGFTYQPELLIKDISPRAGFMDGGETLTIVGTGMSADVEGIAVFLGTSKAEVTGVSDDGAEIFATTPAHAPGAVDVTVSVGDKEAVVCDGFTYVDPNLLAGPTKILSVSPSVGPRVGGTAVAIVANGVTSITDAKVRFGDKDATVTAIDPDHGVLEALTPLSDAGVVDVTLETSSGSDTAPDAFEFISHPKIQTVSPATGPATGGTKVTLTGVGLSNVTGVWFDALEVSSLELVNDTTLEAVTPPGSPGPVAVRVENGAGESVTPDAFVYKAGKTQILAVDPDQGPMGGGTKVNIYGTDLPSEVLVTFGDAKSTTVEVKSASHIVASSVGVETPQTVDVSILEPEEQTVIGTIFDGFTYYNPASAQGGTWGPKVSGTINVSVLDVFSQQGVPDAYVILWSDPDTPYQGYTDWLGQVTFNGPDLTGSQMASAWHPEYSASSIVEFDAENVTILLFPKHPPSGGGGGGGSPMDLGATIAGHVSVYEKYLIPPPGTCEGKKDPKGVLCTPCEAGDTCGDPENQCTALVNGETYCTTPCGSGVDCPSGFACMSVVIGETKRCMPVAGLTRVMCGTTMYDPLSPTPDPGPGKLADNSGNFLIKSRYGNLVVVCQAELYDEKTGDTVPLSMGASQPLYVEPGDHITGVEVKLDVPTNRNVTVQMEYPPSKLASLPYHRLRALISFGEPGVYELRRVDLPEGDDGVFVLARLPQDLTASLEGTTYLAIGGAFSNSSWLDWWNASAIPVSATVKQDLPNLAAENLYAPSGADWSTTSSGLGPISAIWGTSASDIFAVGKDGLIVHHDGSAWALQGGPIKSDWVDLWGSAGDDVYAIGSTGALIHYDGAAWTQVGSLGFSPFAIAGSGGADVTIVGEGGQAARWDGQSLTPFGMSSVTDLYDIWLLSDGTGWAVGAQGRVLRNDGEGFAKTEAPVSVDLYAVAGSGPDNVYLAGRFGTVIWWDGASFHNVATGTTEDLHGLWVAKDGSEAIAVGNRGTILSLAEGQSTDRSLPHSGVQLQAVFGTETEPLLAGGEDAFLFGPLLELPEPLPPISEGKLLNQWLGWTTQGGPVSDFNFVQLGAQWWGPLWNMVTAGPVESVVLPDYGALIGLTNLKGTGVYLQINRILVDGFDINSFEFYVAFFPELWDAWAITNTYVTIGAGPAQ